MVMSERKIVLASASEGRKQIMEKEGIPFEVRPSSYEEDISLSSNPSELVSVLAYGKAQDVARHFADAIILGADTVVVFGGKILGKPKSLEQAREMLQMLSGKCHSVFTGFTIIDTKTGKTVRKVVETKVHLRDLSDKEIEDYLANGKFLTRAGGYAIHEIEGGERDFVENVEGHRSNVMGLPIEEIKKELKDFDL